MEQTIYTTSDLKLQAFLRLMLPNSFSGTTRASNQVLFKFNDSPELQQFISGYYMGQRYELSPFQFSTLIDQGKNMVFSRADFSSS